MRQEESAQLVTYEPPTCNYHVGVAGFEPAASSSRSQLGVRTARAAVCLTWEAPSIGVRGHPLLATAMVTHLVTRSSRLLDGPGQRGEITSLEDRWGHSFGDRRAYRAGQCLQLAEVFYPFRPHGPWRWPREEGRS
jgi:hypothetical protein